MESERPATATRNRITLFRAGEGIPLDHETMPFAGMDTETMAGLARVMASGPRAARTSSRVGIADNARRTAAVSVDP